VEGRPASGSPWFPRTVDRKHAFAQGLTATDLCRVVASGGAVSKGLVAAKTASAATNSAPRYQLLGYWPGDPTGYLLWQAWASDRAAPIGMAPLSPQGCRFLLNFYCRP
jgi:hypothetical protein